MTELSQLQTFNEWLPVIFVAIMGLAMLTYVVLDGYDLGVGMLLPRVDFEAGSSGEAARQKDVMISSIGPFWDANETWLVLGVGLLLVAFPTAHGIVLQAPAWAVATGCCRRAPRRRRSLPRLRGPAPNTAPTERNPRAPSLQHNTIILRRS